MMERFSDRLLRSVLIVAGCYNLAFGIWAWLWPGMFFSLAGLEQPRYPEIWTCLGMVIGLYGFLYWYAAWNPERGWWIVAVGLIGKVLGPIGMSFSLGPDFPARAAGICLYNDLIWWIPFALFLLRGTHLYSWIISLAPWLCVALHVVALALIPKVIDGSEVEPDAEARMRYVLEHTGIWRVTWSTWMASALSLVCFYAWWGARLKAHGLAMIAIWAAAAGMVCDWTGEFLYQTVLIELASNDSEGFVAIQRTSTLLTAGVANSLYTVAGILLTLKSTGTPIWVRAAQWTTWTAGAAMTLAAVLGSVFWMSVATAILFPTLIVWAAWMGLKWARS